MEAAEDAATPDVDADAAKNTTTPEQTANPRKVSAQTWVTTSLIMVTRNQLIR